MKSILKTFEEFNESLRDHMISKDIQPIIDKLLVGNNGEICDKIYKRFFENDYRTSYIDNLYYFVVEFGVEYIIDMSLGLFDDNSFNEEIIKKNILGLTNGREIVDTIYKTIRKNDKSYYPIDMFLKDMILYYDKKKFKKIAESLIKHEIGLDESLRDQMTPKDDKEINGKILSKIENSMKMPYLDIADLWVAANKETKKKIEDKLEPEQLKTFQGVLRGWRLLDYMDSDLAKTDDWMTESLRDQMVAKSDDDIRSLILNSDELYDFSHFPKDDFMSMSKRKEIKRLSEISNIDIDNLKILDDDFINNFEGTIYPFFQSLVKDINDYEEFNTDNYYDNNIDYKIYKNDKIIFGIEDNYNKNKSILFDINILKDK